MSSSNSQSKLTAGISHVGLSVSDIEASFKFFEAIGYSKIGVDESYPSYFLSDGTTMVTLWQTEDGAIPFNRRKNVGLHHLAIKVSSKEALQSAYEIVMALPGLIGYSKCIVADTACRDTLQRDTLTQRNHFNHAHNSKWAIATAR